MLSCVQLLADKRHELTLPTVSGEHRAELEKKVQEYEGYIQLYLQKIAALEEEITAAQQQLGKTTSYT